MEKKEMNALSDTQFTLDKETHTYSHQDYPEAEFQSVTSIVGDHFELFDAPRIATRLVKTHPKYKGMTVEQLINEWDKSSKHGSQIHDEIELFITEGINPPQQQAKHGVQWLEQFKMKSEFEIFAELPIFSIELKIAGTIDILAYDKKSGTYELIDWKTSKRIQRESYRGKVGTSQVTKDVQDCNFNHYALQLSFYRYLLEEFYGLTITNQLIAHLDENGCRGYVTPYYKKQIKAMVQQKIQV